MASHPESRPFGHLPSGEAVEAWTLRGAGGMTLEALTYGGIVTRLLVPDRDGKRENVVLGYPDLTPYLKNPGFLGCIAGRIAGRVTGARFTLEGKEHVLTANDGANHLHGGPHGLNRRLWKAEPVIRPDGASSLRLTYRSPDGEENYPGNIDFNVTYTATHDNTFVIETEATTDRPTPISLTHHSYFNLTGKGGGDVGDHELTVHADTCVPTEPDFTLLDREEPVGGGPDDLNHPRLLRDAQPGFYRGHGALYRVRRGASAAVGSVMMPAARLVHRPSGRVLEVTTTERFLQLYAGNLTGLCLECEDYPNGVSMPHLGDIVVRPGKTYRHTTRYAFSTT